jgi:Polyketide cyclase / dehydrase and lipid transport
MKFLKWLFIIVIVLIALFLLVAVFLPKEYRVERSIVIERSPETVFWLVADFHNWNKWSPWSPQDQDAEYNFSGPGFGPGAKMDWTGDTVGVGEITIVKMEKFVSIKNKLTFVEPWEEISDDLWTFEEVPEGTKVTWTEVGQMGYPLGRYFGLMMDGVLGEPFETGLSQMKSYAESMPEEELRAIGEILRGLTETSTQIADENAAAEEKYP